jgi:hypothetical protein
MTDVVAVEDSVFVVDEMLVDTVVDVLVDVVPGLAEITFSELVGAVMPGSSSYLRQDEYHRKK